MPVAARLSPTAQTAMPDAHLTNHHNEGGDGAVRSVGRDTATVPDLNIFDLSTHVRAHGPANIG